MGMGKTDCQLEEQKRIQELSDSLKENIKVPQEGLSGIKLGMTK